MSKKNKTTKKQPLPIMQPRERLNSLTELALGIQTQQNQISQGNTAEANLRRYMISQNRMLLANLYNEIGLVKTIVNQPVDDALNKMPDFVSKQLQPEQAEEVKQYIQEKGWFETFKQSKKWKRLFGGSGLFINTPQNPTSELRIDRLHQDSPIELYALNRWELNYKASGSATVDNLNVSKPISDVPYDIYGQPVHKSRVLKFMGEEAADLLKLQLMGWGTSKLEELIRPLNQFLKLEDLLFEIIDEYKIDVYKINGYAEALMTQEGTDIITKQIQLTNQLKSFQNALIMDKEDDYDHKQIIFAGIAEVWLQNRQSIASVLRMPMSKIWGISATGFSSGEDDIENYNSMLESEIRIKSRANLIMLIKIACQVKLGFIPEDIDLVYPPLRILSAEQEETVKTSQFNRLLGGYNIGVMNEKQFIDACNKANLFPIEIKVDKKGILARIKDKMGQQQPTAQAKPKDKK